MYALTASTQQQVCFFSSSLTLLLQLSMEKVQAMAEQVEIKAKVVQSEVKALVLRHKKALEERECELLWKVSSSAWMEYDDVSILASITGTTSRLLFLN